MPWVITKQWRGIPESEQPATQQIFDNQAEAERVKTKLEEEMPNRQFALKPLV